MYVFLKLRRSPDTSSPGSNLFFLLFSLVIIHPIPTQPTLSVVCFLPPPLFDLCYIRRCGLLLARACPFSCPAYRCTVAAGSALCPIIHLEL